MTTAVNNKTQETILIVDDTPDLINLLTEVLRPEGYQIIHASNGHEGLQLAHTANPDLIMLDMHMPLMNGLEALEALREMDNQTPVIFMTRFGSTEIAVKAFQLGVHHYLPKPFDLDEVRQTIAEALQQTRMQREQEALQRDLIAAEAIRQTVVTLAHHINNQLMVVQNSLALLAEMLLQDNGSPPRPELIGMIARSQEGTERITAVLNVLQKITGIQPTEYYQSTQMLDITAALEQELNQEI